MSAQRSSSDRGTLPATDDRSVVPGQARLQEQELSRAMVQFTLADELKQPLVEVGQTYRPASSSSAQAQAQSSRVIAACFARFCRSSGVCSRAE